MAARRAKKSTRTQDRRMKWWREARFGMFIHWGLYAIPEGIWKGKEIAGIGEWIMNRARIPVREYEKLAAQFNPVKFNARKWVQVAKRAGMKYLTITSKHHDGFALYKSDASPYNMVDATPFKSDVIKALARECKRSGIRLCFYYSQKQDWHHPDASGNTWDFDPAEQNFYRYMREKGLPQVREILTRYGPIGMIWYDTPQDITPAQTRRFVNQVYELQPDCLVNGRAGHEIGDYQSMGDNAIPPGRVEGDWETPATMNDTWGFKKNDLNWKSAKGLLHRLVDIVGKGGNYLLNVGPTAQGVIPQASVKRLEEMGEWLKVNGEAIYGTQASPYPYKLAWGAITTKPGKLYLHFKTWPGKTMALYGLKNRVKKAYLLADKKKSSIDVVQDRDKEIDLDTLRLGLPARAPDSRVSVVVLEIAGKPRVDEAMPQNYDGRILLEAYTAEVRQARRGAPLEQGRFGAIEGWLNIGHRVSWEVKVAEPGKFEVVVLTQTEHDGRWERGHRMKLSIGRQSVSGGLKDEDRLDNPRADSFLKDVVSTLGRITIPQVGTHRVTLRVEKLAARTRLGPKVRGVQLIPVK